MQVESVDPKTGRQSESTVIPGDNTTVVNLNPRGAGTYPAKVVLASPWQGLTLVHFSAQPEPFLTQNIP